MSYTFKIGQKEDCFKIREEVFVVEQHFEDEFDDIDNYCTFITVYDGDTCIGCARIFTEDNPDVGIFGRLALLKEYRGKHLGSEIVKYAEGLFKEMGVKEIRLHAQLTKLGFYERLGYEAYGPIEKEEYMEHQWMRKELKDSFI